MTGGESQTTHRSRKAGLGRSFYDGGSILMSAGRRPKNRSGKQGAASRERLLQGLHSRRQNAHTGARRFSCLGSGRARSQPLMTRSSSAAPSVVRFYRAPPDTFRPNYAPDHWSCQCPRPLNVTVNVTLDVLPGQAYTRGRPTVPKGVHGKAIRSRIYSDNVSLLRQLGALPAPKKAAAR
jgi:hypothetical protein